jgi:hypothetical protein
VENITASDQPKSPSGTSPTVLMTPTQSRMGGSGLIDPDGQLKRLKSVDSSQAKGYDEKYW